MKEKILKRIRVSLHDPTASGGIAQITLDPRYDFVPSTREPVKTRNLAIKYVKEVHGKEILSFE
jgi:hypothetical protein